MRGVTACLLLDCIDDQQGDLRHTVTDLVDEALGVFGLQQHPASATVRDMAVW